MVQNIANINGVKTFVSEVKFQKITSGSPLEKLFEQASYFTIVQIIFHFLWDHWAHCGIFENRVLLMYTLEGVSSVANFITAYEESQ